ncbi:MAG TPA: SAM-dependent methyltransferase [Polyangiaceae bacterium]
MRPRAASKTAEYIALFRALESVRQPPERRLFDDPLAVRCLRPRFRTVALAARVPAVLRRIEQFIDWRWPGVRLAAQSRTHAIDEALKRAVAAGIAQLVILGAGYDTRAHRLPELATCRVFEVDRKVMLAGKERLAAPWPRATPHLCYVPVDFDRDDLHEKLRGHGFDLREPVFFIWEGVTPYLSADGVNRTLTFVAQCAPRSEVVFTYLHRGALDGTHAFAGTSTLFRTLARVREPFTFGFDPTELPAHLAERGLTLVWESATVARRPQALPGAEQFRIALAQVPSSSAQGSVKSRVFPGPTA